MSALRLPEYDGLDAIALSELVRGREVTAAELLEAAVERADARNPRINAIVARYDDEARRRAREPLPDGPLSGVPFLLKDLLAAWEGHPLTGSSRLLAGNVAREDSLVVKRLRAAGLVLFGQTNLPELGILGTTEPAMRGPTRNPWDTGRSAGGSSGGSAAAVAARIVPAAHGSDGGGSLRIPASACGVFGLKPTRGRVSLGPALGEAWGGLATDGVLTRSVRDSAALLDAIAGPSPGDPCTAAPPVRPYLEEVRLPPGRLRIAVTRESLFGNTTGAECLAAVDGAAALLRSLGHEVTIARPDLPWKTLARAYLVTVAASVSAEVDDAARASGRRPGPDVLEAETRALAAGGRILSAADLVRARNEMQRAARALESFLRQHDVLVTPTTAHPPPYIGSLALSLAERAAASLVGRLGSRRAFERMLAKLATSGMEATANTMIFNETGHPAMSVPLHVAKDGVPVGVQFAARLGDEATLFRLAAQLEAAQPWTDLVPPGL